MKCPCCSQDLESKKIFKSLPISSAMLGTTPNSNNLIAEFNAGICNNCKHIINQSDTRFSVVYSDPSYVLKTLVSDIMSSNLKNILDFIVQDIVDFKDLSILEIGSGSGEIANWFLKNGADVSTIDPAVSGYDNNIDHYQINLDENSYKTLGKKFDIIIARHVIEHINDPKQFLDICTSLLTDIGYIYLEVPNLTNTLETNRLVDFFNDHMQHFTENSMCLLSSKCGLIKNKTAYWLNEAHLGIILYKGQDLYKNIQTPFNIQQLLDQAIDKLNVTLKQMVDANSIAIYGAGAHSTTFASQLPSYIKHKISYVFDRSRDKSGRYLPGIEVPITEPSIEKIQLTDMVINTSSLYCKEIEYYLVKELNYSGIILHL